MELTESSNNVITALAVRYAQDTPAQLEDLRSEGVLGALAALHRYDPEACAQHTFVYKVARDAMVDYIRREQRATGGLVAIEDLVIADEASSYDALDRLSGTAHQNGAQGEILLEQLMDMLTGREREVIELRLQGFDFTEISVKLGISNEAARKAASRAVSHLRDFYG